ncbi:PH domain-containing protein [Bacillus marasmi]|uniref:PH domain-containing protein n=1 Tax=Bacillus marasmi TaxID=1926279 RepID=UPI0011C7DDE5|nr:PH domain-containing protein [Bacillus marasmi]
MIREPQTRISERALKAWKIHGIITAVVLILLGGSTIPLSIIFDWPIWINLISMAPALLLSYFSIWLWPRLKWNRWRYEVRETEIELQQGVIITKRTLVPMIRVQHVDTNQGPILKKYNLASVQISTAATVHEIPALDLAEAEELRYYIGKLTRTADEDV